MGDRSERKKRSDAKINVNPALSVDVHEKLVTLAYVCGGVSKTALAAEIIRIATNTPSFVNHLQDLHHVPQMRRVVPMVDNGQVKYIGDILR